METGCGMTHPSRCPDGSILSLNTCLNTFAVGIECHMMKGALNASVHQLSSLKLKLFITLDMSNIIRIHTTLPCVFNKTESPPCVPLPVRDAHRYEDRKRLSIQPFRCHLETDKTSSCHTEETQRDCLSLDGGLTYNDEMASQSREALDLAVGDLFVIGYHVPPICIWRWKSFDPHALKREFLTVEQRVFAWAAPRST